MAAIDLLLRSVPIIIGAGVVQLVIFLLKRRVEARSIDATTTKTHTESGSVVVNSAERSVAMADAGRDYAVKRAEQLTAELVAQVGRAEALAKQLAERVAQVDHLTARLAVVETEIAVLRGQITELRRPSDPPSVRVPPG